ncbi:SDR family NAD(P)-dependent oxidoreductase [Paenibacillus albus]|uniref:SDR family NAD(P)-dependent oxidoreductase n=1 Tax=Paenibacillus albus TaxID=2495582 RepID=A0A3Q8X2B4_9BACL|nr:SDR family NAD(P)-dependent oxidoreductase [Paenibacillus albus]AZN38830.1 SDR family NAD(P)-dependent oxidoreductase [Paenibacillus albus]
MPNNKKTIIITGANSGLGFEAARLIARSPEYRVILAARNNERAEQAKAEIMKSSPHAEIQTMELDVASLASVRTFVKRYNEQNEEPLFGLVCNAGINGMNKGLTQDGFDIVFETNHLGHFLLTNLLLPSMQPAGRILMVSSDMHKPPGDELTWPGTSALAHPDNKLGESFVRYPFSKLCNLYFTYELSRRLARMDSTITVNALNPGLMTNTNFALDKSRFTPEFLEAVSDRIGSLEGSSKGLAEIMTGDNYGQVTGEYYDRGTETIPSSPLSYNEDHALELWKFSISYTKLEQGETLAGLL